MLGWSRNWSLGQGLDWNTDWIEPLFLFVLAPFPIPDQESRCLSLFVHFSFKPFLTLSSLTAILPNNFEALAPWQGIALFLSSSSILSYVFPLYSCFFFWWSILMVEILMVVDIWRGTVNLEVLGAFDDPLNSFGPKCFCSYKPMACCFRWM